jgi:hypothetical protein
VTCSKCGHALMAHAGGKCHCGCRRGPIPKGRRRYGNLRSSVAAKPRTLVFPSETAPPPPKPPREAFIEYVHYHLTEAEAIHLVPVNQTARACLRAIQVRIALPLRCGESELSARPGGGGSLAGVVVVRRSYGNTFEGLAMRRPISLLSFGACEG